VADCLNGVTGGGEDARALLVQCGGVELDQPPGGPGGQYGGSPGEHLGFMTLGVDLDEIGDAVPAGQGVDGGARHVAGAGYRAPRQALAVRVQAGGGQLPGRDGPFPDRCGEVAVMVGHGGRHGGEPLRPVKAVDGPDHLVGLGGGLKRHHLVEQAVELRDGLPGVGADVPGEFPVLPPGPQSGGGLSGVGFGITFDPKGLLWVANFGFEGKGCTTAADHYTASTFTAAGKALSPETGWEVGGISWPQGTVSDQQGNVWLANCGNDSVTRIGATGAASMLAGNAPNALNFPGSSITAGSGVGFSRPFGAAVNGDGDVFVTGNGSGSVAQLGPNGEVKSLVSGGGLHLPLGIAGDMNGYMWVSNSKWVVAPCTNQIPAKQASEEAGKGGGDVTLIKPNGQLASAQPIKSGIVNPWGITVDGDDNVWVANFSGQRLTELCGTDPRNCPPGKRRTGAPISPEKTGYGFDGLVRNTGVIVDPSGNLWLANNWKRAAVQTNPGGYQIVAYLGLAAPLKQPQIGAPEGP